MPDPTTIEFERPVLQRWIDALRHPGNWKQLVQFCAVGATGSAVNLLVFAVLVHEADFDYRLAAGIAWVIAITNNFIWNRMWTFREDGAGGHAGFQAARFFTVALVALGVNLIVLQILVDGWGAAEVLAQALAIVAATPVNFIGNKLWSFRS